MKGIIFDGESVRAILDHRKTQTRRVMTVPPPEVWLKCGAPWVDGDGDLHFGEGSHLGTMTDARAPYRLGETLYVKEAWSASVGQAGQYRLPDTPHESGWKIWYRADNDRPTWAEYDRRGSWRSPLFLPAAAARLHIIITNARVQRVQEIDHEDAIAEGCAGQSPVDELAARWDAINAKRGYSWESDPWVWAYTFEAREKEENGDAM